LQYQNSPRTLTEGRLENGMYRSRQEVHSSSDISSIVWDSFRTLKSRGLFCPRVARESFVGMLRVEGPNVEVFRAVSSINVVDGSALAQRDAQESASVKVLPAPMAREELVSVFSRKLGKTL